MVALFKLTPIAPTDDFDLKHNIHLSTSDLEVV